MPLFGRRKGKKKDKKPGKAAAVPLKEVLASGGQQALQAAAPVAEPAAGVVQVAKFGAGFKTLETYPLEEPWARARIVQNPETGETVYVVDEIPMNREEQEIYNRITDILYWEMEPPKEGEDPNEYFRRVAKEVVMRYRIKFSESIHPGISWEKIQYYIIRDTVGFSKIDPLMKDPFIEDISCDGVGKPVYVWHRKYESLPTNIIFTDEEELDSMVAKLAHKAGKHVSVAFPIVDAILPGGHRLAATFKREVSMAGSTFTIRKFRETPLSVIDLIRGGSISEELAAYFWLAMEFKMTGLIMGVTGAGKTTMLNALATLFRPTIKVVTVEDTPELKLTLENWVQLVSRPSYGIGPEKIGEVTLYDLIKVSLRYRPDVIIVGEVRGEEAYVLFQAIATGHGGLTTLHAEHIDAAVKRLTSPPMNIPQSYIPLMNFALVVKRVRLYNPDGTYRIARRVTEVWEVREYGDYPLIARWDASERRHFVYPEESQILKSVGDQTGKGYEWVLDEMSRRATVLRWMARKNITHYKDVARYINEYYVRPIEVYERAARELKAEEMFE